MKIECWFTGKTNESYLEQAIGMYVSRINRYLPTRLHIFPDIKASKSESASVVKRKEANLQVTQIQPKDYLVLLDDKGKQFTSLEFASWMEQKTVQIPGNLIFLVGGPYGFDETISAMAKEKISLSKLTFSHQMVRLFLVEQIYRGFAILNNEPYHHE
ncbi:MAG: 23S rRNA (pseudouridine(1915)-N(3))-methyltransferase RlmH [Saprospiraceae bacterium]